MKRFNIILGVVLTICALLVAFCELFEFHATLARTIGIIVGGIVGLFALLQVFNQQSLDSYDPSTFWFLYSGGIAVIIFGMLYALGFGAQHPERLSSFIIGLCISLMPIIGGFLGSASRVVSESIRNARLFR